MSFIALVVLSIMWVAATADQTCLHEAEEAETRCISAYTSANRSALTAADRCGAVASYYHCISNAFSCDIDLIGAWEDRASSDVVRDRWARDECRVTVGDLGPASWAIGWGDPHFIKFDGSYSSCQESGRSIIAAGNWWAVLALFGRFNDTVRDGSVITEVAVATFHPSFPSTKTEFTLGRLPQPSSQSIEGGAYSMVITNESLSLNGLGLKVLAHRKSGHFQLGIVAKGVISGTALNGCQDGQHVASRPSFQGAEVPIVCLSISEPFRAGCVFDLQRANATWAADGARQAETLAATHIAAEVALQNRGVNGGSALLSPTSYPIPTALFLVAAFLSFF